MAEYSLFCSFDIYQMLLGYTVTLRLVSTEWNGLVLFFHHFRCNQGKQYQVLYM